MLMNRSLAIVALFAAALAALAGAGAGQVRQLTDQGTAAGEKPQEQRRFTIHAQTNLVLVDVRVWDKSGKPLTDLTRDDFRVLEDGQTQKITSFSLENIEKLAEAEAEKGPPPTIDLGKLPPGVEPARVLQDRRLVTLYFDMTSMPVDDLGRTLKAAKDFVSAQMTPADLVAVVTYTSTLNVAQNFTNDRAAILRTIEAIRAGEASSLAEGGGQGEAGTTNSNGEEVVAQDVSAAFTPDETEFNIFNTDQKLLAVESLSRMLGDLPGRKIVVHFSSGVERTGIENQAQLRAATDAANRANVSLYTMDARGLAALPPGGDASSASPAGTAVYTGSAVASQFSSLHGSRETLASLARDTGGRDFYDMNDFKLAFQQVENENSSYYLLGYSPSDTRSDGRFRRIRVEVIPPRASGLKVQARPGYYAPKGFRQFTREDKDLQLVQALEEDLPFVDLPLAVETAYFRRPDRKIDVVLAAKIPGSAVSFLSKSATHQTEFDFVWRATDPSGRTVAMLRDTLPVKLTGETYERVLRGNILYEGTVVLPPGKYRLKVVARENQTGNLGTFEQEFSLPDVANKGLSLSSVVLSNELQDLTATAPMHRGPRKRAEDDTHPLIVGGKAVLPSVTRVFRSNQELYVYVESYAGPLPVRAGQALTLHGSPGGPAPNPSAPPEVALVFFRGGSKVGEAGPFQGRREKTPLDRGLYFAHIPLLKFPPGRYWLQVNVLDAAAGSVAFARVPMAIARPPTRPPAVARALP